MGKLISKEIVLPFLMALAIGFLVAWVIKPKEQPNIEAYELKTKIKELEYNTKVKDIENKYLHKLHFVENATTEQVDSLWTSFGF